MTTPQPFPRWVLQSVGLLLAGVLIWVFVESTQSSVATGDLASPSAEPLVRELHFTDQPEGGVMVRVRTLDGTWLDPGPLQAGGDGFVRSLIRGLVRERRALNLDAPAPFELIKQHDGALILRDPLTHRDILLQAFGPTNVASFARFLYPQVTPEQL